MSGLTVEFSCPYCGHPNFSPVDSVSELQPFPSIENFEEQNDLHSFPINVHGRTVQEWTTDCENCCRPIALRARVQGGEVEELDVAREQD